MRRITNERDAFGHEGARHCKAERKREPRANCTDLAEMQSEAPLELGMELHIGQRHDTISFGGVVGPDDRRAPSLKWQDREWPARQEMILGMPAVIPLVRDGGDDAGLAIVPAMGGNAGALSDTGAGSIGRDQQPSRDGALIRKCN